MDFSDKTIAITGGSGYIGSAIIEKLRGKANKIICISRNQKLDLDGVTVLNLDLNQIQSWETILSQAQIVFHLAGNTSVYDAKKRPRSHFNECIRPINHLIEVSKKLSIIPRFVFASTATVYGLKTIHPVAESSKAIPVTIYDEHKLLVEKTLANATKKNIISAVSLRLANVYGPSLSESGSKDRGILNKVAKMSIDGQNLIIYGTGEYVRDYIYIDDVVDAFLAVSNSKSNELVFNVASGVGTSVKEAFLLTINQAKNYTNMEINVSFQEWPKGMSIIEKRNFIGSIKLLKSECEWIPNISFKEGVTKLLEHYVKL